MKNTNSPNLPHIQAQHITTLSKKFTCSGTYVYQIVNGIRKSNSAKARQVLKAAEILNSAIEKGNQKINKEIILIGEND